MSRATGRRAVVLGALGGVAVGAGSAVAADRTTGRAPVSASTPPPRPAFFAARQPGVEQSPPAHACWIGFDLTGTGTGTREDARRLLDLWSDDFARMMAGGSALTDQTGELTDASRTLTITVGLGPGFCAKTGLTAPAWLTPLPSFAIDRLQDSWRQTDLMIQIRCEDPIVLTHVEQQVRLTATGTATRTWTQRGFRAAPREGDHNIGRNAFGQLDGIVNPDPADPDHLIWSAAGSPGWLADGTSLVLRRIRMDLDVWAGVDPVARDNAIGRHTSDGSPLTGGAFNSAPDLARKDSVGFPVIDAASHMRQAMPRKPRERILRAPYTYSGDETGLIFAAYQADPTKQFLPIQRRLAESDLLNLWTTPIGSAVYAIPRGVQRGHTLGDAVFG